MAGNEQIRAALSRTHAHLHLFRLRDRASGLAEPQAEHRQLVAAVVAGDMTAARSAMTTHLRLARRRSRRSDKKTAMSMIDSHHRVWDPSSRQHAWLADLPSLDRTLSLADRRPVAEAADVSGTVLMQVQVQVLNDLDESADFLAMTATDRSGFGLRPNRSGSRSPTETVHLVV